MILHPGIWALLVGSAIAVGMMIHAACLGVRILVRWDFGSSSEVQLALERKTSLVSTIMACCFGFLLLSGLLFVHTAEDLHGLFVGAMCATGALNANPVGWHVLVAKVVLFFLAGIWLAINHLDQRAEDFPLVRLKYGFLIIIAPLAMIDLYLQAAYFMGLEPEIITSCCGALFSSQGKGVASELAGLPVKPVMAAFYGSGALFMGFALACYRQARNAFRLGLAASAALTFAVAGVAVVSFISLYVYELPTHHCPFDMLQGHYGFVGYPLYAGLFCGALFGVLPGVFSALPGGATVGTAPRRAERKWLLAGMLGMSAFYGISSWKIVFGEFLLVGYQ